MARRPPKPKPLSPLEKLVNDSHRPGAEWQGAGTAASWVQTQPSPAPLPKSKPTADDLAAAHDSIMQGIDREHVLGKAQNVYEDAVDAGIEESVRQRLLTPEMKAREAQARKWEAAGFVEVGGTLVRKDDAKKLSREASDERMSIDELMTMRRANEAIWDNPDPGELSDDDYYERQEKEFYDEMNDDRY